MSTQITLRRDTRTNWDNVNPILALAEIGYITDSSPRAIKIGNGSTPWDSLEEILLGSGIGSGVNIEVAYPTTQPDENTAYLTSTPGTYTYFTDDAMASIRIEVGSVCLLTKTGSFWSPSQIVNILDYLGIYNLKSQFQTRVEARQETPSLLRIPGIIITYRDNLGQVVTEQFIGNSWSVNDDYWREFGSGEKPTWSTI